MRIELLALASSNELEPTAEIRRCGQNQPEFCNGRVAIFDTQMHDP